MEKLVFITLFVQDLENSEEIYKKVFGNAVVDDFEYIPVNHPFSPKSPKVLDFGETKIALFEADGKTTRAGDTGIGLFGSDNSENIVNRVIQEDGQMLLRTEVKMKNGSTRTLTIFVLPNNHFFELIE